MHYSVLQFDLRSVALQLKVIFIGIIAVVVVYIVKGYLIMRLIESSFDVFLCSLQVSSLHHDIPEILVAQLIATDWGKTYVVSICVVLYHKSIVVQNGTCSEPFHDELPIIDSLVIWDRKLDDTGLDEDETINL